MQSHRANFNHLWQKGFLSLGYLSEFKWTMNDHSLSSTFLELLIQIQTDIKEYFWVKMIQFYTKKKHTFQCLDKSKIARCIIKIGSYNIYRFINWKIFTISKRNWIVKLHFHINEISKYLRRTHLVNLKQT